MNANHSLAKSSIFQPSSQSAWIMILGLIVLTVVGSLVGFGGILRLAFPAGAVLVGFYLYIKYPLMYIGFTWWLWFLTPFLRRLVDYSSGWINPNPMLTAPYLVTLISLITLIKYLPRSYNFRSLPLILAFAGIAYGFVIGIIQGNLTTAIRSVLDWLPPVSFAFHLLANWQQYPSYKKNMERVFLWGVLVMGCYGIIQFLIAPVWDISWLKSLGTDGFSSSFGQPEPFEIRVWSTMASTGPFAGVMGAGLILLLASKDKLRIPAMIVGYLSFLLTLVRSSWISWLFGLIIFFNSLKSQSQLKIIAIFSTMFILVAPLATTEPFSDIITTRFDSFSNLGEDHSANARKENYATNFDKALSTFVGRGIGNTFYFNEGGQLNNTVIDSGILDMFFSLGWVGTIPYLGGMGLLLFQVIQFTEVKFDIFMAASRSVGISMVLVLLFNSSMTNVKGMILWSFLSITVAGHQYHQRSNN
jgi:hypothetical protein